jgi:hypothetical protein
MACSLNREQVLDLYEVLYGEVTDRLGDSELPAIDLNKIVQDTYNVVNNATGDQVKAMLYAQAIPDVFHLVTQDNEANDYLVDNDFDFTALAKMRKRYADLTEVGKAIATKKKSKQEIDSEIKNTNKSKKDFVPDVNDEGFWSYNEDNGAKVSSAWTTSIQIAEEANPETVSDEDRNKIDPEKKLFSDVVKAIVKIVKQRIGTEEIEYNGVVLGLTAQLTRNIPGNLLTAKDRTYLIDKPNDVGIAAVITDAKGNYIYFKPDGTITDNPEEGRIVYQYLRKVNLVDGRLLLSNRANRHYNLVDPEVLARRQADVIEQESNGKIKVTDTEFKKIVKGYRDRQDKEMNELYQLRKLIEESDGNLQIILPILGGTFGIPAAATKLMTIEEAGLTENEVKQYVCITVGKDKGKQYFIVQKTKAGGLLVDEEIFLQRSDIDKDLAEKIADVLTTTAELRGRQLTPDERKAYFEVFINNALMEVDDFKTGKKKILPYNRDRIRAIVLTVNNQKTFYVELKGEKIPQDVLFTEEGRKMILDHLLGLRESARPVTPKAGQPEGSNGYWPANVQFNNEYKSTTFTEYTIEGDKITDTSIIYWNKIKPYVKLILTDEANAYENGLNAYLTYAIPEGTIESEGIIPIGRPKSTQSKPTSKPKTDKEETKPLPKKQTRTTANSKPAVRQDSDYTVSMKEQIKEAGGNSEKYKSGLKVNELAELVGLTEEEIISFRATALEAVPEQTASVKPAVKEKTVPVTEAEAKETRIQNNPSTRVNLLDDIINGSSNSSLYKKEGLNRTKLRDKFLDKVFTSKSDRTKAETWWNNSPLSKFISLERVTEIVNSDAFATWSGYGITLYEADGGTMVDVYHEAWHGFSQLLLTKDEKIKLYEEVQSLAKFKGKSFFDIEESLAEEFRSYAKSKGKKEVKGILGKLFDKIYQFIQKLFGKATKKQVATNLQDITSVKELFDKLYRASENPEILSSLKPSMDNVMFGKLNRAKTINDNFTLEESKKIADAMDSMMSIIFQAHNRDFNTTAAALKLLKDPENKKDLYRDVYNRFERLSLAYVTDLEENYDLITDPKFIEELELLDKITTNFGNLTDSLDGKEKNNVIAYHLEKSRYRVLRDQYIEIEDPSNIEKSNLFKLNDGNTISSKELASEDTMMLLASIFKVSKENGEIVTNRDGLFGLPVLQDIDITWNRLAKILEGSFDEMDMYSRIFENSENYPELEQLQTLLPNPFFNEKTALGDYTTMEFASETNFWQDFKKPRIPYIQLNLNKEEARAEEGISKSFEARVAKANFDVYQVIQDWKTNFMNADSTINPYVSKDKYGNNILNTAKIVKDFGTDGRFNYRKANEFLQAIGIVLDQSSSAIKEMINNRTTPFSTTFGVDRMYEVIKKVDKSASSDAFLFKKDPLTYLINGLPESLRDNQSQSEEVQGRIRVLAGIQNAFSDSYSNFSVQTPEGNRVWEHMVDNTITRIIAAINYADNWQQLTTAEADPNGKFKHMRWLNESNNTFSPFSKLLNSIFDLDQMSPTYGQKISDAKLVLQNVAGTQMVGRRNEGGTSTASMDATSKYLQEFHTMLLNGVEEFMRHASKNTAMGMTIEGDIKTYNGKKASKLYVDMESFLPYADGTIKSYDIIEGYIAGEANRIFRFQQDLDKFKEFAGYNRKVKRKDGKKTSVMAGQAFTAFDDILLQTTQKELYSIIDAASDNKLSDFNLMTELDNNPTLRNLIRKDVEKYFDIDTDANYARLQKAKYVDKGLIERIRVTNDELTEKDIETALVKAYTYNSFIHKMETVIIAYGDLVQYDHAKEEFHKRNAGLASGGKGFRADKRAQIYVSSLKNYYADRRGYAVRNYDGTLQTAIIKEMQFNSVMYKEYRDSIEESIYARTKNRKLAKENADKAAAEYFSTDKPQMKIADGQGIVSFETYRRLKHLEGNWGDTQELLYRKVSMGENITAEDVVEFFPPYKLQYFGNIESTGLPVNSFHKFSLAPIIPGVGKEGTPMYDLHEKMMKDQIDYVLFESGSKVAHIGTGDVVLNPDGTFNKNSDFTINTIYAEYLKNQTEVNATYKGKSIFSTQLRKLILEGLYEQGVIKSTKYQDITNTRVKRYLDHVEEYTNLLKIELLEEMGYEETTPGEFKAKDKSSIAKLINMIRTNLEREDVLSDDLIEFIDVFDNNGDLVHDLSFHPEAAKIEKLLLSMINKRVIKQKVTGEPLVQVSVGLYANQFTEPDLRKATKDEVKKWASATYLLPTYHKKANGYTAATKVMIAMQGSYYNLFNLEYANEETVGVYLEDGTLDMDKSLARLNEKIKDDSWLDANDGAARKAITIVGVRIPVQGLNSMEFAEVFEFLPPQAGNIIIPAAEIVAKSGGDFDIDKLTIFMNTLDEDGNVIKRSYKDNQSIKDLRGTDDFSKAVKEQKAALENELIEDIRNILELPDNYSSLVMPNGTFILKDIAEKLSDKVSEYNPKSNKMTDNTGEISPTRVLEAMYNIYKHESNIVGKKTLGLGAIENTFNVIMNSLGAYMPDEYTLKKELRKSNMRLRNNKMIVDGKEVISMSDLYDVDGIYKVGDVISQMMNGWVDVEKDAWIFFIQGNYEVAPTLLYLVKAGVPVKEAIYFVSNPLVREYVDEQRLAKSTFADVLNKKPDSPGLVKYKAASEVIRNHFDKTELAKNSSNDARYLKGQELLDDHFKNRKEKTFTEREMEDLIDSNDKDSAIAKAMFLHYLELEQQISGYTALKMSSNPDTATKSTLSDVEQSEANIEELEFDSRIPREILNSMMNDSVISSFFNGPMALAVSRPLFKLRYHKQISDYLIARKNQIRNDLETTFPGKNVEMFSNVFRNDIVSFILQNALRKYKAEEGFMSLNMETKIPTSIVKELKRGAFVKGGTLYVDVKQLQKEFKAKTWIKGSDSENSYEDRGLYPLHPSTFMNNEETNFSEYQKFVSEREYLRSIYPLTTDYSTSVEFQEELKTTKELFPDLSNEKAVRYTYEKLLAIKALDNSYNFFNLFQDSDNAFAIRMSKLLQNNPQLAKDYPVLSRLKLDSDKTETAFNILLADKDFDNDKSNLYSNDLKRLADPTVQKVSDPQENARISDMFKYLSTFAFLQTGLNKTKLSFTNVVDYTDFLTIVEDEVGKFTDALDKKGFTVLDNFYDQFIRQNSVTNLNKNRFKDYLSGMDYANPERISPTVTPTQKRITQSSTSVKGFKLSIDKKGKDQGKADLANRFIGYGVSGTSTYQYQQDAKKAGIPLNYEGVIDESTVAFVSVNGNNKASEKAIFETIENAREVLENGGTIVMDSTFDATRSWNQNGEALVQEGIGEPTGQTSKGYNYWGNNPEINTETSIVDSTNMDTPTEVRRLGLKSTDKEGVFMYNDSNAKNIYYYTNIGKNNPDVVFIHNTSVYEIKPEQIAKGTNLGGASNFMSEIPSMSINFPTNLFASVVNGKQVELSPDQYQTLKNIWEKRINIIKQIQEKDGKIAFPEYGFGDPNIMPQELFVYLSKRLFEEFQYVNPGSTKYDQMRDLVSASQGISDAEILIQLGLEEDPFKCS